MSTRDHCLHPECSYDPDHSDGSVRFMGQDEDGVVTFLCHDHWPTFNRCQGCLDSLKASGRPDAHLIPADLFVHNEGCPFEGAWG